MKKKTKLESYSSSEGYNIVFLIFLAVFWNIIIILALMNMNSDSIYCRFLL